MLGTGAFEERSKRGLATGRAEGSREKVPFGFHYKSKRESITRHDYNGEPRKRREHFGFQTYGACSSNFLRDSPYLLPEISPSFFIDVSMISETLRTISRRSNRRQAISAMRFY